ncbi:MAG: DUF502 domain-containing protein [Chitinivibrionales bacterium]|nr:DUF502 domain-containing protein [Chitinivibrionales bacterium]MBD3394390.1 DUF502 domain-containing protein [Chitinivibrionales bacterium]
MRYSKPLKTIRNNIVGGVLLLLPVVTTAYVFFKLFTMIDSFLPTLFHSILPFFPETWIPGIGLLLVLAISYFVGLSAKNYIGRFFIDTGNAVIASIPLLNKVYLAIQQILDAVVTGNKQLFDRAVLIEYPKKNSFCIAFVTSEAKGEIPRRTGLDMVSVFVPTTPNPTSGFLLFIPRSDIIELDMNVETAVKTVVSAGMVNPEVFRKTNHMYKLPQKLKGWNWMRIFRRDKDSDAPADPRD